MNKKCLICAIQTFQSIYLHVVTSYFGDLYLLLILANHTYFLLSLKIYDIMSHSDLVLHFAIEYSL